MKAKKFPHSLLLISIVLFTIMILTWILPSGKFDREEVTVNGVTKQVVVPNSYREVEPNSQGLELLLSFILF